jgi:hypothetical protein
MAALVPAIHVFFLQRPQDMDGGIKSVMTAKSLA